MPSEFTTPFDPSTGPTLSEIAAAESARPSSVPIHQNDNDVGNLFFQMKNAFNKRSWFFR
jgi:hypothetical protein